MSLVIERLFDGEGRLAQIPARLSRKRELALFLVGKLERGRRYSETEINEQLMQFHDDYVSLRRMLVDFGLLARDADGSNYETRVDV